MRQLTRKLAIAAALALVACSDDVEPAAPFEFTEPDAPLDTFDASDAETSSPDTDAAPDLPPAPHNVCDLSDPAPDSTPCPIQDPGAYGDCDAVLGVVFDGTQCVTASGCECQGDDCPAFDSLEACVTSCAQGGYCQTARLPHYLAGACPGETCFDLTSICAEPSGQLADFETFLTDNLPGMNVRCTDSSDICAATTPSPHTCLPDDWCCTFIASTPFDLPRHHSYCALTLLPNVRALGCLPLD
ncbi:hypothetical protein DV096_08005 [Bradymonadaceae bacterium TMQ3]|nr:hypothetical protein DV096_08005 [Bradymonadaceae bacterium TMQ3]TXC76487.1 hypothetical protein FRC91_07070 [Bradymonadales bacterium TMQ1]